MTRERTLVYALRVGAVVLLIGIWWYASGPGGVSRLLVPAITSVGSAISTMVTAPAVGGALIYTLIEIAVAAAIASLAGVLVGFWVARRRSRCRILEPMLAWGYMAPIVLFYPVFILIFGIGPSSKVAFSAVAGFFPIAYVATRAFSNVDAKYTRMARAFGGNPRQIDWTIKVRAGMPMVRSGLRIGIATCMIMVILAEMLGSAHGLGYLLAQTTQTLAIPQSYALTALLLALAIVLQGVLDKALSSKGDDMVSF